MRNQMKDLYYRNGRFSYYYGRSRNNRSKLPKSARIAITAIICLVAVAWTVSIGTVIAGSMETEHEMVTEINDPESEIIVTNAQEEIIPQTVTLFSASNYSQGDVETVDLVIQIEEYDEYDGSISTDSIAAINLIPAGADTGFLDPVLGEDRIVLGEIELVRMDLPDEYYDDLDYSSFQPYMSYKAITNTRSKGYAVCNADEAYTDENGLRRFRTTDDQFTIDGADDYIVALGTFYKEHGTIGNRYLIVTTTGMFTVKTGDEKADAHTDEYNMFSMHGDFAGIIEWIVDPDILDPKVASSGNITKCPVDAFKGEILYIYRIY